MTKSRRTIQTHTECYPNLIEEDYNRLIIL